MIEILEYLEKAEEMDLHLLDFFDDYSETDFANLYFFWHTKPQLEYVIKQCTSFQQWGKALTDSIRMDEKGIFSQLESCLKMAHGIRYSMTTEQVAMYIDTNEYAYYCYERLRDYVDNFWFAYRIEMQNEEEDFSYEG